MTKDEYRNKIKYFLRGHHYKIIEDSPITLSDRLVFEIEGDLVIKLTDDEAEIKAAKKMKGKASRHIANIKWVKDYDGFYIIVVQKINPLSDYLKKSHKKFKRQVGRFIRFQKIIKFLTFGKVTPKMIKFHWMFGKDVLRWIYQASAISKQAQLLGVENPSDFMSEDNLGIKMGTIASFDIRDEVDENFYEEIK